MTDNGYYVNKIPKGDVFGKAIEYLQKLNRKGIHPVLERINDIVVAINMFRFKRGNCLNVLVRRRRIKKELECNIVYLLR